MKTFVFDADGVLCVGERFTAVLERQHGIPQDRLRPFFAGPFLECIRGRRDLREILVPHVAEWGWPGSVDELMAFWFRAEHVVCAEALEGVRALRKKGHRCVLGTNQEKHRAAYLRHDMGLAREFDGIFASGEIGEAKPDRAFFRHIEAQLQVAAGELCLIDDAEQNVRAARSAGWSAIWYRDATDLAAVYREAGHSPAPASGLAPGRG
ncbi:MAG: HAD-IA family hydrolase [Verrucomicrobia bacterium]|nr:HAD-IA family hydrolase [Verrucomicrobiota bacterium]